MNIGSRGVFLIQASGIAILIPLVMFSIASGLHDIKERSELFFAQTESIREIPKVSNSIIPKEIQKKEKNTPSLPVYLKIPKIEVNAKIEYVGITTQGAIDVPKDPTNTAWYNLGPRPGEIGNAIIVGHYGTWKNGIKSVFENLNKLKVGDSLFIEDKNGGIISFIVRDIRKYDPYSPTTEVFVSNDGKSHLNLITCEGIWNKSTQSYSKRLVIFTDKVGE